MKYIIAIGIFQALAAAILLWRSRLRSHADGLLIALLTCIALRLSIKFFIYTFVTDAAVLSMMNTFIGYCFLPLLYLYTIKIIRPEFVPSSRWYVFIPFIIAAITFFSVASVLATNVKAGHVLLNWYNTISLWTMIPIDLGLSSWIIYHAQKSLARKSDERKLIVQIAFIFLVSTTLSIVFIALQSFNLMGNYLARSIIYAIQILICIRIIAHRYAAVPENSQPGQPEVILQKLPEKRRELLSIDEMTHIILKLETVMTIEKYYRDSELTLDKLAEYTKFNKYHISETLNHFVHKPFYTFVNEYRIQEVRSRIEYLSGKEFEINMLSLAYDAGFNSKSSFNRYFKEIMRETPTSYCKKISLAGTISETHLLMKSHI